MCAVALMALGCGATGGLSSIQVKAHVDLPDMGGLRPIAKDDVYLLSNSITSPEMEEAFKAYLAANPVPVSTGKSLQKSQAGTRGGFMWGDGQKIWMRYVVDRVATDFQGRATFRKVKTGDYWIFCSRRRPNGEYVLWNAKTTVNFYDTTTVVLDNQNIAFQ